MSETPNSTGRKTSIAGIMLIVSSVITCVAFIIDGNPATNPDWSWLQGAMELIGIGGMGISGGAIGLAAKDNKPAG